MLAQILITHLLLPAHFEEMDEDEQDNIKDFRRYAVGQTLRSCALVIGDEDLLGLVMQSFSAALQAYNGTEWRAIEASVYALRSIARCVPLDSEHILGSPIKAFFETLPRLPAAPLLQYTAILVVGRYADWLRYTPAALPPMLTYITNALRTPGAAAPAAALAFLHICESCSRELVCYAEDIFVLIKGMLMTDAIKEGGNGASLIAMFGTNNNSSGDSCNDGCLNHDNVEDVIDGAADVFAYLPANDIARILGDLVIPHITAVQTLLTLYNSTTNNNNNSVNKRDIAASMAGLLRRVGTLFKHIYPEYDIKETEEHPTIAVFRRIYPTVETLLATPALNADDALVEQVCRCLRGVVTASSDRVAPLLRPLLEAVLNVFSVTPSPSILYLLNVVVECTCEHPQPRPLLTEAFCHASNTVFQFSRSRDALATNPLLVAEYFELAITCMCKIDISQTQLVAKVLHLGLGALRALQAGSAGAGGGSAGVRSVLKFLAELLHLAKAPQRADLRAVIAGALPHIVHSLLVLCGGCGAEDRKVLGLVARIVKSFAAIDKAAFMGCVAACLGLSCSDGVIAAVPREAPLPPCGVFAFRIDFRAKSELYNALEGATKSSQITGALEQFRLVCKSS